MSASTSGLETARNEFAVHPGRATDARALQTKGALRIEALRSIDAVARLAGDLDALNLVARRPCPFSTFGWMQAFLAHDENEIEGSEILVLAAFEGERLVAYLPLGRYPDHIGGLPFHRIGMLVWHDTDRPHVVARAEDEPRACDAFYGHLLERERGWSFLELVMQDDESGLSHPPALDPMRFHFRTFENRPNTTIPFSAPSFDSYWKTLASPQRRLVGRFARRLFASGAVELVASSDPRARLALLELYLDLERRSWKEAAGAGIGRDPRRVAFFRELCSARQPLALGFDFVLQDGLPISGLVSGAFAGGMYGLEMAFDRDYEDVAPGHLLTLAAIRRAFAEGRHSLEFGGNYAYYKSRWGGVVTPTHAVQIFRVGSLPWLKARAGELRRRLRPPEPPDAKFNPERRRVGEVEASHDPQQEGHWEPPARPARTEERALAAATLERLRADGARVERLAGRELEAALPFSTRRDGG